MWSLLVLTAAGPILPPPQSGNAPQPSERPRIVIPGLDQPRTDVDAAPLQEPGGPGDPAGASDPFGTGAPPQTGPDGQEPESGGAQAPGGDSPGAAATGSAVPIQEPQAAEPSAGEPNATEPGRTEPNTTEPETSGQAEIGPVTSSSDEAKAAEDGLAKPDPWPTVSELPTPHPGWVEDPETGLWYGLTATGNWLAAEAEAQEAGGHLVTVRSLAHLDWLRENFGDEKVWIGLSDQGEEGVFVWANGEACDFRFWEWGRPDNFGTGENFVYMNANLFGEWNDGGSPRAPSLRLRGLVELPHPPGDFDGDGLSDDLERVLGTHLGDLDSDDDGLTDFEEHRGWGERGWRTDPTLLDTDGDGLTDGQEAGRTRGIEGNRLRNIPGTNLALFRPDADPETTTDATRADSDLDGVPDGVEDRNRNGRLDPGETNPLDSGDQGLKLRTGNWHQRDDVLLEIVGAEPGARVMIFASRRLWLADLENGGLDVLVAPLLPLADGRALASGEAQWVVRPTQRILGDRSIWIQAVEIGADGRRRLTQPINIPATPTGS